MPRPALTAAVRDKNFLREILAGDKSVPDWVANFLVMR
jgi:hypothetical protein